MGMGSIERRQRTPLWGLVWLVAIAFFTGL